MDSALLAGQVGVAGLGLAGFSTIIDLLHMVKTGLKLWEQYSALDADIEYFRAQIMLQQDMLDTWQRDWFDFPVGTISSSGRTRLLAQHSATIESTLRGIESDLGRLNPSSVLTSTRENPSATQRMKWIMGQKDAADTSLKRIESLLRGLFALLPLQSRNPEMRLMISLLGNLRPEATPDSPDGLSTNKDIVSHGFTLRNMRAGLENELEKRVKEAQQNIPTQSMAIPRPAANLKLEEGTAGTRSRGLLNGTTLLVEWKNYGAWWGKRAILLRGRNDNLARMLNAMSKPEELLTFHCRGYFDDVEYKRYGFVFDTPARPGEDLVSLNRLLYKPPPERLPNLEQRYQIAYSLGLSISILQATEWLHKGIRSHNILFIQRGDSIRWSRPYLCGFAYSRPDKPNEESEKLEHSERFNVYRHPLAQGQPDEGYRKAFDIYSFGVMLFEIAIWSTAFPIWNQEAQAFREELISKAYQMKIAHRMGTDYLNAMLRCLNGYFEDKGNSTASLFYTEVIEVLGRLVSV